MLIGGAVTGIVFALPLVVNAVRSMQDAARTKTGLSRDEMPIRFLYFGIAAAAIMLSIVAVYSVEGMGIIRGVIMALVGTLWIWMAGVILSECIAHSYGLAAYADVMSCFAAGERYLNRAWCASADGYIDEIHQYIDKAREQFASSLDKVLALQVAADPPPERAAGLQPEPGQP